MAFMDDVTVPARAGGRLKAHNRVAMFLNLFLHGLPLCRRAAAGKIVVTRAAPFVGFVRLDIETVK